VKPNIESVEVHAQLSNNRHPVKYGALEGAGSHCKETISRLPKAKVEWIAGLKQTRQVTLHQLLSTLYSLHG